MDIRFERKWSMPSGKTFTIKPIKELIVEEIDTDGILLDPFANNGLIQYYFKPKIEYISNDLDTQYETTHHLDALDFLKKFEEESIDFVLYDPPYCYDNKTEIFTKNGWKLISEITYDDEVFTLNSSNNMLEYQKPTEVIKKKYVGEMHRYKSQSIDLLVTPNHRMWIKDSFYGKYSFIESKDIKHKNIWFQKACDFLGQEKEFFFLPKVELLKPNRYGQKFKPEKKIKMDIWLKFLGLFISEGCCKKMSKEISKHNYIVSISQTKKEGKEKIEKVLNELGYNFTTSKNEYRIQDKQLYSYLKSMGDQKRNTFPLNLKN